MESKIPVSSDYFWLPVCKDGQRDKVELFVEGDKVYEMDMPVFTGDILYYAPVKVSDYQGKTMICMTGQPQSWIDAIRMENQTPGTTGALRPKIHFTSEYGWMNDPNGLVYANGVYHLYYQWNPYGTEWGNMHWGHAVSTDLFHWQWRPAALFPDAYGTMYSGCGIQDTQNCLGKGSDALVFYYTAAGRLNDWSKGMEFRQMLAYSIDGGETLVKSGITAVGPIVRDNRDTNVFYHKASGGYVMALYLEYHDYAIFRSDNLIDWTQTQKITMLDMGECPDLFELQNTDGSSKWVFWGANGNYFTGDFNGYIFIPDCKTPKRVYKNGLAYAAQSWSGVVGRHLSIPWLRTVDHNVCWRGMMGIPQELTMENGQVCIQPARELEALRGRQQLLDIAASSWELPSVCDMELYLAETVDLFVDGVRIPDVPAGTVRVILDDGIAEVYAEGGLYYFPAEIAVGNHLLKAPGLQYGKVFLLS